MPDRAGRIILTPLHLQTGVRAEGQTPRRRTSAAKQPTRPGQQETSDNGGQLQRAAKEESNRKLSETR